MPKVKKIELSFVCDEDWSKMTPVKSGRHCSSCEKTVHNFTGMSDAQIVAFYSKKENEKTCGQFRNGQLEHINKGLNLPKRKDSRSWFKPVLASALLSMSAACSPQKTKGESEVKTENKVDEHQFDLGEICVDTTNQTRKEDSFQPRKISHVGSLEKKDSTLEKNLPEVRIDERAIGVSREVDFPKRQERHLGGVPAITHEKREIQHFKGDVDVSADTVNVKRKWHQRIFKKNK